MAGYSGTPLVNKLGIKPESHLAVLNAPKEFDRTLGDLPGGVVAQGDLRGARNFEVIVFFTDRRSELTKRFPILAKRLTSAGGLWIAWPKRDSGVATDLNEDAVRQVGLDVGLVDNKVCAIDETWSGLRFVIRLRDRQPKSS
jgi:hypothetical protein